ncbi:hypothetical protein ACEN40_06695 [Campylobacter bilis]
MIQPFWALPAFSYCRFGC